MYKNIHNYKPFQHDNLAFKNNVIGHGRAQDINTVPGAFSAVLIYANLIDYLARNLLENLYQMISVESFQRFGGVFFYNGSGKKTNVPLGSLIQELNFFEFPNKEDFLVRLKRFNELRIELIHNLMQLNLTGTTKKLDDDIKEVQDVAEDILLKYNTICGGIAAVWNLVHQQQPSQDETTNQPPEQKNQ